MTRKFECSELHLPLLFVSVFFHLYRAKQTLRYGIRAVSAFAPPSSSLTRHACPVSEVEILKRNLDTPQNPKLLYQVSNYGRVTLVHEVEYDCWIWKQERISVLKKMDKKKGASPSSTVLWHVRNIWLEGVLARNDVTFTILLMSGPTTSNHHYNQTFSHTFSHQLP